MNDIVDMSQFVEAKSDQLNADDLIGGPRTITVRRVTGSDGDQPVSIYYEGDNNKPFKPCKTVRRVLLGVWGKYASDYVGRQMTIYRDDSVTFGGLATGGIRVSHMSNIDQDQLVVVMKTKGKKAGIKIQPLVAGKPAPRTTRQTAEQWADEQAGAAAVCATLDSLTDLIDRGAKAMDKLKGSKPELFAKVIEAYSAARAALEPEGKADADTGEGFVEEEEFEA